MRKTKQQLLDELKSVSQIIDSIHIPSLENTLKEMNRKVIIADNSEIVKEVKKEPSVFGFNSSGYISSGFTSPLTDCDSRKTDYETIVIYINKIKELSHKLKEY